MVSIITMWRILLVFSLTAVVTLCSDLQDPGDLAPYMDEEEFEDYLDKWLEEKHKKQVKAASSNEQDGCAIRVNGDLSDPQPVYLCKGNYIVPTGTTGIINLQAGEEIYIACTGSKRTISHPNIKTSVSTANAICVNDILFAGSGWLDGVANFTDIACSNYPHSTAEYSGETCYNNNTMIQYGYTVDDQFYPLFFSCFDQSRLEAIYSMHELGPANSVQQTGVERPGWSADSFYPGVDVNTYYTKATQKETISKLVGKELSEYYVTSTQYLARGHLTPKTDLIFASGQRSTFYFTNAAPQWQSINAGNWNWLEQSIRNRVAGTNYYTRVYSGTFGVSQLRDQEGLSHDLYLYYDENNNPQIPAPMYYYKVVYEPELRLGTVFITINNPFITEVEAKDMVFCADVCRNNTAFDWISWKPDNIQYGWSFCCKIDEFTNTVPHLPEFEVVDLLI